MSTKMPFAEQAALFCLFAPITALVIGFLTNDAVRGSTAASLVVGAVCALLVLAGPVFGIIALLGMRRHGTKGILGRVLGGLAISAVCLVAGGGLLLLAARGAMPTPADLALRRQLIGTWESREPTASGEKVMWLILAPEGTYQFRLTGSALAEFSGTWSVQRRRLYLLVTKFVTGNREAVGRKIVWGVERVTPEQVVFGAVNGQTTYARLQNADGKTPDDLEREYQIAQAGLAAYPTWLGVADVAGARIVLSSHDDRAPFAVEFRGLFATPATLMQVGLDNTAGTSAITIDPASARLGGGMGKVVAALPPREVVATAKREREKWLARHGGNIAAPPGGKTLDRVLFFPYGTSLADVTQVALTVNGVETVIPGRLLSAKEFMDLYQRGKEQQQSRERPPPAARPNSGDDRR